MPLYVVESPINRQQRENINNTFQDIRNRTSSLQNQINIIQGNDQVQVILDQLQAAITTSEQNNTQVNDLITQNNQLVGQVQQLSTDVQGLITDVQNLQNNVNNTLDELRLPKQYVKVSKASPQSFSIGGTNVISFENIQNFNNADFCTISNGVININRAGTYKIFGYINKATAVSTLVEFNVNGIEPLAISGSVVGSIAFNRILNLNAGDNIAISSYTAANELLTFDSYATLITIEEA